MGNKQGITDNTKYNETVEFIKNNKIDGYGMLNSWGLNPEEILDLFTIILEYKPEEITGSIITSVSEKNYVELLKRFLNYKEQHPEFIILNPFAFRLACAKGNIDIVKLLIETKIKHSDWVPIDETSINLACMNNRVNVTTYLLSVLKNYPDLFKFESDKCIENMQKLNIDTNLKPRNSNQEYEYSNEVQNKIMWWILTKHQDICCTPREFKSWWTSYSNSQLIYSYKEDMISTEPHFIDLFNKCRYKKRFVFIELTLLENRGVNIAHANMLLYDGVNNSLERFEPFGENGPYSRAFPEIDLDAKLKKYFSSFLPDNLKYTEPKYICYVGPQNLEKKRLSNNKGYCAIWVWWYLDLRLSNPDFSPNEIVKYGLANITDFDTFIADYSHFMEGANPKKYNPNPINIFKDELFKKRPVLSYGKKSRSRKRRSKSRKRRSKSRKRKSKSRKRK